MVFEEYIYCGTYLVLMCEVCVTVVCILVDMCKNVWSV